MIELLIGLVTQFHLVIPFDWEQEKWELHVFKEDGIVGLMLPEGFERSKYVEGPTVLVRDGLSIEIDSHFSSEQLPLTEEFGKMTYKWTNEEPHDVMGGFLQAECQLRNLQLLVIGGKKYREEFRHSCQRLLHIR